MSEANTTDVADTVHNSTLVVDQYTPEDFLASSHRISDTLHTITGGARVLIVWVAQKGM